MAGHVSAHGFYVNRAAGSNCDNRASDGDTNAGASEGADAGAVGAVQKYMGEAIEGLEALKILCSGGK